ncbi:MULTISPECIES: Omp28-related outer membrane protein [unclassified Lentimicrobium]|uniref:T9SS type A sorting domain-containing protein n=1 Tax=unclassified Lentimicrobium TaxID=2677434 RepID=UPI001557417C|nr:MULTISPECIES: Omp28-related outer membrane protein [unclassified Lentimicrobium]NPD46365.1 Omp28-related outer membrane protein [Lentimicrobium sp. S6]NPD84996.1 Omp28-related outer membrane protein [Lentimicrobium sp. L6]
MKNLLLFSFAVLISLSQLNAQSIVGTDPENKNVVLEEFTGIHCVYCPEGHVIAQGIQNQHPEDVILINIHQGSFASPSGNEPDFRTEWGNAIAGQTGLTGYPSGTVNRHIFSGGNTALGRGSWTGAANTILGQSSYLNVGCEAFCTDDGQLLVNVEVYYTGDSPEASNFLNVAILQSHIFGPQTGGGAGNNYEHMHMLRHLITGQWGEEISETSEGSLYTTTLSYQIPDDYNDVPVVLEDLDIVAFVTETHQEVVSGIKGTLTFEAANDYDVTVSEVLYPIGKACIGDLAPQIELANYGAINLTSADIEYSVNGGEVYNYEWTGELEYTDTETITLPAIALAMEDNNELVITISNPNGVEDENPANNTTNVEFEAAPQTTKMIEMQLYVGSSFGNQISWDFKNGNGEIIAEGSGYSNNDLITEMLPIVSTDCYTYSVYDAVGNGFAGNGYLKLKDDGVLFEYITSELEDEVNIIFLAGDPTGIHTNYEKVNHISIYPNPTYNNAQLTFSLVEKSNVQLSIYNVIGSLIMELPTELLNAGEQNIEINTTSLEEGIYFVNLNINNEIITKKITVLK